MPFSQEEFDYATNDFLEGNGIGIPSPKVCETLMFYHKGINKIWTFN